MSVAVLPQAAPALHVLPQGVRRRLGRGDALLALVLAGELLSGMGVRVAWDNRDALGGVWAPQAAPPAAVDGSATSGSPMTTTSWVVVPPAPVPTEAGPPPPPPRTTARNPFQAQVVG